MLPHLKLRIDAGGGGGASARGFGGGQAAGFQHVDVEPHGCADGERAVCGETGAGGEKIVGGGRPGEE